MLARMVLPLSVVGMLFGSGSSSSGSALTSLTAGGGSSSVSTASAGSIKSALVNAEKNAAKQMEQVAKDPQIQKELARYEKVVKNAKSLDEVLDDPVARKVFMTANGLKAYRGLHRHGQEGAGVRPDGQLLAGGEALGHHRGLV
jgi:hypothetical protein